MPTKSRTTKSPRRTTKSTPSSVPLARGVKQRFQRRLLTWYKEHGRDLPWRKTSDPYHILVSEVMLQQTQVDRVIPKYHEFLARYPTFAELAGAPVAEVKQTWYPLGYNIRPERLHSIARETVVRYGGQLPSDPDASCAKLRTELRVREGVDVAVVVNDSHGRAWRNGTVGVALGAAGLPALLDLRGRPDLFDRTLRVTEVGLADEIASAASIVMGQGDEGRPVVLARGVPYARREGCARELVRAREQDLFR